MIVINTYFGTYTSLSVTEMSVAGSSDASIEG